MIVPMMSGIPSETKRIARAAFPNGSSYLRVRDALGPIFRDAQFAELFAHRGRPAEAPWRLALVVILQFAENLPDRQAAEMVRSRIDWKYLLGLPLEDSGFAFTVLTRFRARLLAAGAERRLFDQMLACCAEQDWLSKDGTVRSDSSHVLTAVRDLNRLECVGETVRLALNRLAVAAPDWLAGWVPAAWHDRYDVRVENHRLPEKVADRTALATTIGEDGATLLARVWAADAPEGLAALPAIETLRRIWLQPYALTDQGLSWREPTDLPPSLRRIQSPHDPDARYAKKRDRTWTGAKVHLTEQIDPARPHLIVDARRAPAPELDHLALPAITAALTGRDRRPATHLVDAGYITAETLVAAQAQGIDLLGPPLPDTSRHGRAADGFSLAAFTIDFTAHTATCPGEVTTTQWSRVAAPADGAAWQIRFPQAACAACPLRAQCVGDAPGPRTLKLRPEAQHLALQAARTRFRDPAVRVLAHDRAGIEGTIAQATDPFGLRQARYRGDRKLDLQIAATAAAVNLARIAAWLAERPRATTRISPFAALTSRSRPAPIQAAA